MRGYFFGVLTIPLFFALGTFLSHLSDSRNNTHFFANQLNKDSLNFYHLRIVEPPIVKETWVKCEAEIKGVDNSTATGKALIYFQKNDTSQHLKYGDNIYAQINFFEVNEPLNPHEFNYKNYLLLHDIHHQAFVHSGSWIKAGSDPNSLFEFIYSVKDRCNKTIEQSGMSSENISVAKALLLGDKNLIDAELMLSYTAAGALHVLAVSGLHVGIVMLILTFIFTPIKRIKNGKIFFVVLALCGVWFYAIITGLSPSVLRAAVMFSFVIVGNELQRDTNIYQSLLVSAFFLILIDPTIIFKIGFLLSYLAVLGIVFFHPKIYGLFHFKNFLVNKIWQISSVSIAAQIATFPLGFYCFQQFPNFFLLANLVVIPLSFVILILGISYLVLVSVPIINEIILFFLDWSFTILNTGVKWVEQLPYSVFWGISIQWYDVILLYGFILAITFSLINRSKKMLALGMAFLTLTVGTNWYEKFSVLNQNKLIFYSIKNEPAIDIYFGQESYFLALPSLISDSNKLRYHIYPNRYYNIGHGGTDFTIPITHSSHLFEIENKKILLLNQKILEANYQERFPVIDVIYLSDIAFLDQQIIELLLVEKTKIILGYNVSYKLKAYLKKCFASSKIYDLKEFGAVQITF